MTSLLLDSTHDRTTSGVACHHRLWAAHTVERHYAWHAFIALGRQTRSYDVRSDMPSSPLDSTLGQTTSGVAYHHRLWQHTRSKYVRRGMPSLPLGSTHSRTTLGVACHQFLWAAHMVERFWMCHDITALGLHARSDDVGRGMTSPPLDSTHDRTMSGVA